jgi:glycine betaine/proline transport system substrate-binding protein
MGRIAKHLMMALLLFLGAAPAHAASDLPSCKTVHLADVGWTDVTATTGMLARVLRGLGYDPEVRVLSIPVTFNGMARKDIDVFLGNWIPAQDSAIKPYLDDGSIERVRINLGNARYTLAVPKYLHDEGLTDFADISKFAGPLNHKIYGIEPGNDGNAHVLKMIAENEFGLGDFTLVESSEQGMLAQVERAVKEQRPMVFLGWQPHPMNTRFNMAYLSGGDDVFGPNFGGAKVYTTVRKGYLRQCPNVGKLLENLAFTVDDENALMAGVMANGDAERTAQDWLAEHPERLQTWLDGVTTIDGAPAVQALSDDFAPAATGSIVTRHKIPVGQWMTDIVEWTKANGGILDIISRAVSTGVTGLTKGMQTIPPLVFVALATVLTWFLRRSVGLTVFVPLALLFIINQGYWAATIETLALVVFAAATATVIGVPIGIWAGHRPRAYEYLRSVLDLMQTLPTFVYLIPTLVIFGLGVVPGLISTIIFSLPAPIRLTQLGIASVPQPLIEAGEAFGATRRQLLFKVELPSAAESILAGITQCIMLSLSMVVIAALVGAGGLGVPVVRALNTVQVGMGFEAGFAIVLLAIILDRVTRRDSKGDV